MHYKHSHSVRALTVGLRGGDAPQPCMLCTPTVGMLCAGSNGGSALRMARVAGRKVVMQPCVVAAIINAGASVSHAFALCTQLQLRQ